MDGGAWGPTVHWVTTRVIHDLVTKQKQHDSFPSPKYMFIHIHIISFEFTFTKMILIYNSVSFFFPLTCILEICLH